MPDSLNATSKKMKPSEKIREIWEEIKERDRLIRIGIERTETEDIRYDFLSEKYENVEILFGHESTLSKAIIFYLDQEEEEKCTSKTT